MLRNVLDRLRHLDYGLAVILGFIGGKLVLHWAHGVWERVPEVPTALSLGVILVTLAVVTVTSVVVNRREAVSAPVRRETADRD
jgi:predicted tellurium resistance membrane protein TerC